MLRYSLQLGLAAKGNMRKKIALLLLGYALVAQAVPDDAVASMQDDESIDSEPQYTSAPKLSSAIA